MTKILYITTTYKWHVHGVTRAYYDALIELGYTVELNNKARQKLTDKQVDDIIRKKFTQVWVVFSWNVFTDEQAAKLRSKGIILIGFNLTRDEAMAYSYHYNIMFSATDKTIDTVFLPPAPCEHYHKDMGKERDIDVMFFGNLREHRIEMFKQIKDNCPKLNIIHLRGRSGDEFISWLNRAKIGICFDFEETAPTISHRIMEMAACGLLCIVPYRKDLAKVFEYGNDILGYNNIEELCSKIKLAINIPHYRQSIVDRCLDKIDNFHTSKKRVETILKALESNED